MERTSNEGRGSETMRILTAFLLILQDDGLSTRVRAIVAGATHLDPSVRAAAASRQPTPAPRLQDARSIRVPPMDNVEDSDERRLDAVNDPVVSDPQTPVRLEIPAQRFPVVLRRAA